MSIALLDNLLLDLLSLEKLDSLNAAALRYSF